MYRLTRKESSSGQKLHSVIIHSTADFCEAESLRNDLKGLNIEVTAAHAESDLDEVLRECKHRCIVYLSPKLLNVPGCKRAVLDFADRRGRDAVVVVLDDALRTVPDQWADFTCLRCDSQRRVGLCRELALLVETPQLECRPQDITGYAAAFRVFNGYLRFVLPNFHTRLTKLHPDDYASCAKKYLFICPESCQCPPSMEVPGSIDHPGTLYLPRNITRAGQKHRDMSASVYRIRDERHRDYYFPAVFAESLASLHDIKKSGLAGIDETHVRIERNRYILHLQQLLQHDARNFTAQCRILFWRDEAVGLDKFLLPVVREELVSAPLQLPGSPIDFPCVDGHGVNPGSLYSNPAECYKLDSEPKGVCLIINIAKFESPTGTGQKTLPERTGSEVDVRKLRDLFQWLKFEVHEHSNVNKDRFLAIVHETRKIIHSAHDAFVCCIMSHGSIGHIYTADLQRVAILEDIAHSFYPANCPTLDGKPKMFFIQSCQVSGKHGSVTSHGTVDDDELSAANTITGTVECDADQCYALETKKRTLLLPDKPDFFMSYSTLPGSESYREKEGTWYIQSLTEELKKNFELRESLNEVAQRVERKAVENKQQRPFHHVSSDHKLVYLNGKPIQ